jgi:hypothetical protein
MDLEWPHRCEHATGEGTAGCQGWRVGGGTATRGQPRAEDYPAQQRPPVAAFWIEVARSASVSATKMLNGRCRWQFLEIVRKRQLCSSAARAAMATCTILLSRDCALDSIFKSCLRRKLQEKSEGRSVTYRSEVGALSAAAAAEMSSRSMSTS